jgi:FkbM family methyltransferase
VIAVITRVKPWLVKLGVYRIVRFVYRHTMNRAGLAQMDEQMDVYRQFVRPGDLCFDVGANRGVKAEALLRLGARVVAVEPIPACIEELRERLGHYRTFQCVQQAVGAVCGTATIHIADTDVLSSVRPDWFGLEGHWKAALPVPMTTLDALIETYGVPRYCKIDVEGLELDVLQGLSQPIAHLSFEFHLTDELTPAAVRCLERLTELGRYRANLTRQEPPRLVGQWMEADAFIDYFKTTIATDLAFDYGDIYVSFIDYTDATA